MSEDWIEIEIINWEKYNPRNDRKGHTWFRLENTIANEPKFFGMSPAQKFIAICLFAEVSKSRGEKARIRVSWLADLVKVMANEIYETIQCLVTGGVLRVPVDTMNTCERKSSLTTNDTNERTIRYERNASVPEKPEPPTKSTWEAYSKAYLDRHKTEPVRNATVNAQLGQFVKRLGHEEAPLVAAFYLTHNDQFYVRNLHAVGLMLKDAEKLRTEWATGRKTTSTQAKQIEKSDYHSDQLRRIAEGTL